MPHPAPQKPYIYSSIFVAGQSSLALPELTNERLPWRGQGPYVGGSARRDFIGHRGFTGDAQFWHPADSSKLHDKHPLLFSGHSTLPNYSVMLNPASFLKAPLGKPLAVCVSCILYGSQ